ncbi:MAG TPA: prolyl oligopeptidase family serine peptidase [Lacipirellulaceae bacterium]|nr:prolyl oligopeptidase family serine peptidase [Lacipirellulaceae bacterium]
MSERSYFVILSVLIAIVLTVGHFGKAESSVATKSDGKISYPETRRVDQVDEFHGVKVEDPYRWLEADVRESSEVAEWVAAQNKVARAYLDAIPQRPAIARRLTELYDYERYSAPTQQGGKYFYLKNDGLQNQSVLYVADRYDADGRMLVDPNEWSEDGTVAMRSYSVSDDGRYLAYTRADAGSDWQQIYVLDIDKNEMLEDQLKWVRFGGIDWTKDGRGFYYNRYPEPPPGEEYQSAALNQMVYFHKLGTKQEDDQLIYRRPDHPDWGFSVGPTDDGNFLVLSIDRSTDPQNQVYVREASAAADAPWTELIGDFENQFSFVGSEGKKFFFLTDLNAPTKRIVTMDIDQPGRDHVTEIVPAQKGTLDGASILSGRILAQYLVDVLTEIKVFDLEGKSLGEVERPGFGSVHGFSGDQEDTETFYVYTSYNTPARIYRYDVTANESQLIREPSLKFDPEKFEVEQVFYNSKDGTRIPMMLAYLKRAKSTERAVSTSTPAPRPTLLYAYGGYSISLTPGFNPDYIAWMEMGGIVAVANLRGGGEYGEEWHQAGKTLKKQNVFDDFIAAAEWLIAERYTSRAKLSIMGGSNGGLLVGACEVQRPDLYGACIPMVGVLDMLRFHQFTAGQFWRDEYGNVEDESEFKALYAYSPYHNVKPAEYPATLIMSADTDDRVVPMHSFKFAAALQRAQQGDEPILLRIETRAGHGGGTPVKKLIDIAADRLAFLAKTLAVDTPSSD